MKSECLILKFNNAIFKWGLTIFFLCGNLFLLAIGSCKTQSDWIILITVLCVSNTCALLSFVLFSIFPKWYYEFDENGVAFYKTKSKNNKIDWGDIISTEYVYAFGIIPEGLRIKWSDRGEHKIFILCLSIKDINRACDFSEAFKETVQKNKSINN